MRRYALAVAALVAQAGCHPVLAQQIAPAPGPQAVYFLSVTHEDITKIGKALGAMPYNEVHALIAKLQGQIVATEDAWRKAAAAPKPAPKPEATPE